MAPRPTGSPSTRPIGAVAIGQPAIDGALVIGETAGHVVAQGQVAFPRRAEGRGDQHVGLGERRLEAGPQSPLEVAGPGSLIGVGAGTAQFECPLEQVVAEVGQLRRRRAAFRGRRPGPGLAARWPHGSAGSWPARRPTRTA